MNGNSESGGEGCVSGAALIEGPIDKYWRGAGSLGVDGGVTNETVSNGGYV